MNTIYLLAMYLYRGATDYIPGTTPGSADAYNTCILALNGQHFDLPVGSGASSWVATAYMMLEGDAVQPDDAAYTTAQMAALVTMDTWRDGLLFGASQRGMTIGAPEDLTPAQKAQAEAWAQKAGLAARGNVLDTFAADVRGGIWFEDYAHAAAAIKRAIEDVLPDTKTAVIVGAAVVAAAVLLRGSK